MRLSCALFVPLLAGCSVYDVAIRGTGDNPDAASTSAGAQVGVTTGISGVTSGTDSGSGGAGRAGTSGIGGGGGIGTAGGGAGTGGASGTGNAGSDGSTGSGAAGSGGTGGGGGTGAGGSATGGGGASSGSGGAGTGGAGGSADAGTSSHAFLESAGAFSIEAEHFGASVPGTGAAQGVTWQNSTAQPNTSGSCEQALPNPGVNVWDSTVGPELAFDLKFSGTGTYAVWVRILGAGMMADSVHVAMDSAPPVTYGGHGMGAGSTSWVWTDVIQSVGGGGTAPAQINVTAPGYHTLRVYMRQSGVAIDKIVLTQSGPAPSGLGPPESARE